MEHRVYNFSSGPAAMPLPVLEQAQRELLNYQGLGASIMEMSHRSDPFVQVLDQAEKNLRALLKIPGNFRVLFLQGGARMQFVMIPMNLMPGQDQPADYIVTGTWGKKAVPEAEKVGKVRVVWDGKTDNYARAPRPEEYDVNPKAAYLHYTSNETIQGVQFPAEPSADGVPLVCDASSDILSHPLDVSRYGLIYAGAQKNLGPAGVTLVVVRDDLLERAKNLPEMLCFRDHAAEKSMLNTPPTFAVYLVKLVTEWLLNTIGGLENMAKINEQKAKILYEGIDQSGGFYQGHAQLGSRSVMNVTWKLPTEEQEKQFLAEAQKAGLSELKGHRSVGGIRAAIYNAISVEGVQKLREFMSEFQKKAKK